MSEQFEDVFEIEDAEREGARLVIGIAGISGSGKTYTALQLAYGLANYDASKVGFIDAENRRGALYADALRDHPTHPTDVRFKIGHLYAPFSPQRYINAILQFQRAGVEVLVIDSGSHEWEGQGGCEDIAHAGNPRVPRWNDAKREHKRFMNTALQCDMHIIICFRAREKVDMRNPKAPVSLGVQPITEKNVMFEMTASMMMWDEGRSQDVMKCPAELRGMLGRQQGYITSEDGQALRKWVDGARTLDPRVEHAKNSLRTVCEQGMAALVAAWKALPQDLREALSPSGTCPAEFKTSAQAFDAARANDNQHQADDLNEQLLGDDAQAGEAA